MIHTLTLNPALDRELTVPALAHGAVLRATDSRIDAGGKGFNVSRMLRALGTPNVAVALAGGDTGRTLERMLRALSIDTEFIWLPGETRVNTSIVAPGDWIKANEAGPLVGAATLNELAMRVRALAGRGDTWVLAGSLPPGAPANLYATLMDQLHRAGVRCVVDTSGSALHMACMARPWLIKPNREELESLVGGPLPDDALLPALRRVCDGGPEGALLTLGKDGAILCQREGVWRVMSPAIQEINPVGAGDCFLAGFVWATASGHTPPEALRWAAACGAAAAMSPGTAVGNRAQIEALLPLAQVSPL
jgi:1-phosphofructokinase family hexose kinase